MTDIGKLMNSKQLELYANKTECLIVSRPSEVRLMIITKVRINNVEAEVQDAVKTLGTMIDNSLSFKKQINLMAKTMGYHLKNIVCEKISRHENH